MSNIKEHKHILLCGDNFNSLGLVRSIGEMGCGVNVIVFGGKPHLVNRSRYMISCDVVSTLEEGYSLLLEKYGNEPLKPFLYCGSDNVIKILDENRDALMDKFYFFHGQYQGAITNAMDKYEILCIARKNGLNILDSTRTNKGVVPGGLTYPIITKAISPAQFAWKNDMIICSNEEELKNAYRHIVSEEVLIQKYLEKKNELVFNGVSYNNGNDVVILYCHQYLRMLADGYGGYLRFTPAQQYSELYEKIKLILREVGYNGIFEAEFLVGHNDELYFLEINFRNAAFNYAHTYGGVNLPYLWATATLDQKLDMSRIMLKEQFDFLAESDDYRNEVIKGGKTFCQWWGSFHNVDCYSIWNPKDIKPGVLWWSLKFLQALKIRK